MVTMTKPPPMERQLALLAGAKHPLTQDEAFTRLPYSYPEEGKRDSRRKAFARDLEALQALGAVILAEDAGEGEHRYRLMAEDEGLSKDFLLEPEEALRLRSLLDSALVRSQLAAPAGQALAKLLSYHAPFDEAAQGEEAGDEARELGGRCEKLRVCAAEGRACTINYPDHQGNDARRDISPGGLFFRFGKPYCAALCHRDGVVKAFSVERMSQLRLSREAGRPLPAGFKLADFASRNAFRLGAASGAVTARLRVLPEEAWRLKERMPAAVVSEDKAGVLEAEFEVSAPERFFKFVLGFGEFAQILSPPQLKQDFLAFLDQA